MERLTRVVGPVATNVHVLADARTREAIAIDTATPSLAWISDELAARDWTLKLIVSTHGHWDHIGDNAAVADHTGAEIAVHPLDRERLLHPQPLFAPFDIPPSVPAVELAEGGLIRFGEIRLRVLHTPGHTEGSVCLLAEDDGLLFSGDTLFAGAWGRVGPAGRRPGCDGRLDRAARGPRGPPRRVPRPRIGDDDRPRACRGWNWSATGAGFSPELGLGLRHHGDRDRDRFVQPARHVLAEPARDAFGSVDTMTSSTVRPRTASLTAATGSRSPTSPSASAPISRRRARTSSSRALATSSDACSSHVRRPPTGVSGTTT